MSQNEKFLGIFCCIFALVIGACGKATQEIAQTSAGTVVVQGTDGSTAGAGLLNRLVLAPGDPCTADSECLDVMGPAGVCSSSRCTATCAQNSDCAPAGPTATCQTVDGQKVCVASFTGSTQESNEGTTLAEEAADAVQVHIYRVSLGDDSDCAAATFSDVFDDSADTSDCVLNLTPDASFIDIASGVAPTLGTGSVSAGTYSCLRVTMCDQLVWSSTALATELTNQAASETCSGTQYLDIYDADRSDDLTEAAVRTYYWSTEGETAQDEDNGTIDNPMGLSGLFTVTAGETTTLTLTMTNATSGGGMNASATNFGSSTSPEISCDVEAPTMSISAD